MADEDIWKRRFHLFLLARLFGLAIFFLGLAVIYSDLLTLAVVDDLGAILVIAGTIDAVFAPRLLKKMWAEQDRHNG